MQNSRPLLLESDFPNIYRARLTTLQVNMGYLCNLSCTHCHVNAGPNRTELMDRETIDLVLKFIQLNSIEVLDITGGSPEMNPHFTALVKGARSLGVHVMDRCNPTILVEPGHEKLADFLAEQKVEVVASLPCYSEQNVDKQRGKGVFADSIKGLVQLNRLGYAQPGSGLVLNLVYNPDDPVLPPSQIRLQAEYKLKLRSSYGIEFNELFVLANMPISRFGARLLARNQYVPYMSLLRGAYQEENLNTVMCRTLISIDYQGYVYDCDFNQMLKMPLIAMDKQRPHLSDLLDRDLTEGPIAVGEHCYGCTAGQGSSCGGALHSVSD